MKTVALAVMCAALGGCAYGVSTYTVTAKEIGGKAVYELSLQDGKEYEGKSINFQTNQNGAALLIGADKEKAFKGQAIGAKAMTILPVTSLEELVK